MGDIIGDFQNKYGKRPVDKITADRMREIRETEEKLQRLRDQLIDVTVYEACWEGYLEGANREQGPKGP